MVGIVEPPSTASEENNDTAVEKTATAPTTAALIGASDHSVDTTTTPPQQQQQHTTGRLKEEFSADESLHGSAMDTQVLTEMTFGLPANFDASIMTGSTNSGTTATSTRTTTGDHAASTVSAHPPIPVSSSSSTCTRESDPGGFSDAEGQHFRDAAATATAKQTTSQQTAAPLAATPIRLDRVVSDKLNAKVALRKTSRQGRSTQRWLPDAANGGTIRLVTGCVPILKGGKILFVSSSRKPEWIIPKGGWEQDEALEESAVRECFEEAGVLGVLGPKLKDVQYETRKAKKRRLEMKEQLEQEQQQQQRTTQQNQKAAKTDSSEEPSEEMAISPTNSATPPAASASSVAAPLSNEVIARIREEAQAKAPPITSNGNHNDQGSVSSANTYSQVRLALFPLYVSQVLEKWPEYGRLRKAVDIDTAIKMTESRPEFCACLQEVKDRGLHLVSETTCSQLSTAAAAKAASPPTVDQKSTMHKAS